MHMPNQTIDTAALRLYYLQQLGVSLYVPRELAGNESKEAATSAEPAVSDRQDFNAMPAAPGPAVKTVAAGPKRLLLNDTEISATPPVSKADTKPAAVALTAIVATTASAHDETNAIAPFQLLFCMPEPRLALALQIPALAKPALQEAETRLLQNMLRWLGIRQEGVLAGMLHFKWPLPGMPVADAQTAGRNLQVFLQQAAAAQPLQHLLLLGQGPAQCLEAVTPGASLPYQCWATHSLAEMLAVPELKREVWRQLLPLHGRL